VSAEVFTHGETALFFTPDDPKSLAQSVLQLVYNEKLRSKIGDNIRKHVGQNFTWEKNAQIILSLYNELKQQQET
jgi:glycosyltransferase involved in cell wall biosynthesis